MPTRKIWSVYEVGSSIPIHEIEAQFEGTALDHAAVLFGKKRDRLYAIPRGTSSKGKRAAYVTIAWNFTAAQEPNPDRRYQEANYSEVDVPDLLAKLRARGVETVLINDRKIAL